MSQLQDAIKKISDYFTNENLRLGEQTRRNAVTESGYSSSPKKIAKLLGQTEKKNTARSRVKSAQLKSLIGETQRSDLNVILDKTMTDYYGGLLTDYTTKKTQAEERKAFLTTESARYQDALATINYQRQQTHQQNVARWQAARARGETWAGPFPPPPPAPVTRLNWSKPSWANWDTPMGELDRQTQLATSYSGFVTDYTTKLNEATTTAQTKYNKNVEEQTEIKNQFIADLQTKLKEVDITPKLEAMAESRTKAKPNPADRARRSTAMTPKVDQPTIFENRPL